VQAIAAADKRLALEESNLAQRARGHARALNAKASSTCDTWRQVTLRGRSKVVLRCQNIFRFGVAIGGIYLDHASHISAWLAPQPRRTGSDDLRNWKGATPSISATFVSSFSGGASGSFGLGRFGILLLGLNLPEFVASPLIFGGFEAIWRLFGIVTYRGQGQCPVLNLEEGSDNLADANTL
jgi:hypothetical protein